MALSNSNNTPSNYQEIRRKYQPQFNTKKPIERDVDRIVGGEAAAAFQGLTKRSIVNKETGESVSKEAFVFACLGSDGKFKNIPSIVNESVLALGFKKMNLELPIIKKANPFADIPGMEGFDGTFDIDREKLYDVVYPVRGKLFTVQMNQKQGKSGIYYFAIDLETLTPVIVGKEHKALQQPEQTKPESTDFDWDE